MYLRELPEALFTFALYDEFVAIEDNIADKHEELAAVLKKLPPANLAVTRTLCFSLHEFALHCEVNKMTSSNLAIVFAPTCLYPGDKDPFKMVTHLVYEVTSNC